MRGHVYRPFGLMALGPLCWTALVGVLAAATALQAQQTAPSALDVLQLRHNIHVIAGAGAHVTIQSGEEGVIVVDSGSGSMTAALLAAIRNITQQPIRYVINTNGDADHVGGNEAMAKAGEWFVSARAGGLGSLTGSANAAGIIATESVGLLMAVPAAGRPVYPASAWPTESFSGRPKLMRLNGEGIEIVPFPAAHGEGDLAVFFRGSDVIAAGDLIDMTKFPIIDVAHGGSVQGLLDALNRLKDMAIPSIPLMWKDGGTLVVPGHGRIVEKDDVVQYRDMVTIVRDVVQDLVKRGKSVEEVVAAEPALGFARRFAASPDGANAFVRSIYASLTAKP